MPWRWRIWTSRAVFRPLVLAGLALAALVRPLGAQTIEWDVPTGIVAQLDRFQTLRNMPRESDSSVIDYVKGNERRLPPFFIMEMARRIQASNEEDAVWWYHVAYIRGVYDASRCSDTSAADGLGILPRIAPEVADIAIQDQATYRRQGLKVLEWSGLYRSEASPWWICSHGERAMANVVEGRPAQDPDWLRPRRLWPSIRAKLTSDFTTVFIELEPLQPPPPPVRLD